MQKECISCSALFEPSAHQIKKSDFKCFKCRQAYGKIYRAKRKENGISNSGSKVWDEEKKRTWLFKYNSNPAIKKKRAEAMRAYRKDPVLRARHEARWAVNRMRAKGVIKSQPCAFCGKEKTEAHHPDYSKPLLIVWLCRKCHTEEHQKLKKQNER